MAPGTVKTSPELPERKTITIVCSPLPPYIPLAMSDGIGDVLGREAADCIGDPNFLTSLVHPEDVVQIIFGFFHLYLRGFHIHDYRVLEKPGTFTRALVELQLVRDSAGNPDRILFYLSRPALLAEAGDDDSAPFPLSRTDGGRFVVTVDDEYRIRSVSRSIESVLGYKPGAISGRRVSDLIPPDYQPAANAAFLGLRDCRMENALFWIAVHHRDGDLRFMAVDAAATGGERLITASCRDITGDVLTRRMYVERTRKHFVPFDRRAPAEEDAWRTTADPGRMLTAREQEVLSLIARGKSNKEIADRLRISSRTVEAHRSTIMRKLRIRSHAGLIHYAIRMNFLSTQQTPSTT